MPFGLLNINKPSGISSRDAVNRVQQLVKPAKVGHAGTLDPLASGVLVLCLGPATRLIPYVQRMSKRYRATFILGQTSDTEDITGTVSDVARAEWVTAQQVESVLPAFTGEIMQRPPAYSALKVDGQRAYKRARRGETVDIPARSITIHNIQMRSFDYPNMQLDIECGSGTYVRSLGRDIAERLGTGAVMSALVRTAVGPFDIDSALAFDGLDAESLSANMIDPLSGVSELPTVALTAEEIERIGRGQLIANRFSALSTIGDDQHCAAVDDMQHLVAILVPRRNGQLGPLRNFPVR
jgi:tRNA pseudouridine55 synthase